MSTNIDIKSSSLSRRKLIGLLFISFCLLGVLIALMGLMSLLVQVIIQGYEWVITCTSKLINPINAIRTPSKQKEIKSSPINFLLDNEDDLISILVDISPPPNYPMA
jgi:uncharacterized membrane protein YqjE